MNLKILTVAAILDLAAVASSSAADSGGPNTYILLYDNLYDQQDNSLSDVACSSGKNGLLTRGYQTFGSIPSSPFIGGALQIKSWNSSSCGICFELTYTDSDNVPTSLSFTAINMSPQPDTITISFGGLNALTSGNAQSMDGVLISAVQLPENQCGL